MKKLRWLMILCAAACLLWGAAAAEEIAVREIGVSPLTAYVPLNGGTAEIRASEIDGETWLFLPAFAEGCSFAMDGEAVELDALEGEAQVLRGGEAVLDVSVMRSENLRALFLLSDDPVNEGREFIDNCEKHENETTGSMVLVGTDGVIDHSGRIRKLRGRGNGTWTNVKKPYQMKLEDKVDLLDSGDSKEDVCRFTFDYIGKTLHQMSQNLWEQYLAFAVVFECLHGGLLLDFEGDHVVRLETA